MPKKLLFTITVVVLVIAFAVSAFMVGNYVIEGKKSEDRFEELAQQASAAATTQATQATEESTGPAETTEATEATEPGMIAGYEDIYNQNNDTVGWIKLEGTKLNYPVMQTPDDPNFYLYRDFDKKDSTRGSIYAWGEADVNEPSDNITIFGHNMADGSMFNCLGAYTSKTAWENNPIIMFDTLDEYHTYKIFAVFKTSANLGQGFSYHKFVDAADEAEFNDFVAECKRLSFYDTGITPVYGDKLICLSTCEYTLDNGRLVVAAVRIT
ncbi:MAG: class B sortase [Oscillospiraceae bacterium]|nr:class B sortase [Oscillospiraceae bacterium]